MRINLLIDLLILLFVLSCTVTAQTRKNSLRPSQLIDEASAYLNKSVEVEVLEPLYGPSNPQELASVEFGQVEIRFPEGPGARLSLVPQAFKLNDRNRYRQKFGRLIESPVRVRGEFLKDEEMSKSARQPDYVSRVSFAEPIDLGQPEKVSSLNEIRSDPARWDRKLVVLEGVYQTGFEESSLEAEIWLGSTWTATIIKPPDYPANSSANRVRVTGILFSKPGAHYGHLAGYRYELMASKIEYLGVVR
jgi:hypothetical protein